MKDKVVSKEKCFLELNNEAIDVHKRFFDNKSDQIDALGGDQKHYMVSSMSKVRDKVLIYTFLLQVIQKSMQLLHDNPEKLRLCKRHSR